MSVFMNGAKATVEITDPLEQAMLISVSKGTAQQKAARRAKITVTEQDYQNFINQYPAGKACYPTLEDYRGYVMRPHLWD